MILVVVHLCCIFHERFFADHPARLYVPFKNALAYEEASATLRVEAFVAEFAATADKAIRDREKDYYGANFRGFRVRNTY